MQPLKKEDSIYKGHFPIVFHVVKKTRVTFDYGLDFSWAHKRHINRADVLFIPEPLCKYVFLPTQIQDSIWVLGLRASLDQTISFSDLIVLFPVPL